MVLGIVIGDEEEVGGDGDQEEEHPHDHLQKALHVGLLSFLQELHHQQKSTRFRLRQGVDFSLSRMASP